MTNIKKSIWLLSAYRSDSHAYWADWLVNTFDEFQWHKLELSGRFFRWRIRGNPLSWLHQLPDSEPDLIIATSMVDLATLKGLHPRLADVPCVYYFHENQFAYPVSKKQVDSVEPKMVQLYASLAANRLVFNSAYNKHSFLNGVEQLLKLFPDEVPQCVTGSLEAKSSVLPVVIEPMNNVVTKNRKLILWNHRWEYDKAPDVFVEALQRLKDKSSDFELALLGSRSKYQSGALCSDALHSIEKYFGDRIIVNGKVSKEEYQKILSQASIVVSTAIHEFQGLAVLEAVSAGCVPVVPDDLCYREQYAESFRYKPGDSIALAEKLSTCLNYLSGSFLEPPDVTYWSSKALVESWRSLLST